MREADKDGDGALSKEEFMAFQEALFAKGDSNADGKLALEEIAAMLRRLSAMGPRPSESMPGLPPGVVPPPPPPGATISLFMRYDADGDGKISKDEMPEKMRPFLASMDSNGDGFVDEEEAGALAQKAVPAAPAPGAPSVSFLRYDQDNDGAVSREEMPEALGHLIDRLDANGDGKVDRAELDQMRQRMESMGGGRGAGGDLPQPKVEQ
ncbi:MAG: transaldolase/EF-hand domain-containing protein [candidate division BRC1 bacterium ADurb.BinA364]|nr:MAG: transaldolase/EF-hand domain-containing protein [candidate division BRC1 bacterium ADurb.BinA364]